jgi:SAM-dependent methyltransferase
MRTKVLPEGVVDALKRHRLAYRPARAVRIWLGDVLPPRHLAGLEGRVHFNDFMLTDDSPAGVEAYKSSAMNVIANIEATLDAAQRDFAEVKSWLDFGCGYGRVIRFLVQRTDRKWIYAADVIKSAVDFCANEFGVNPVYSHSALGRLDLRSFDFIYAISVLTHLNEENSIEFLRLAHQALNSGGIVLFTTHGRASLEHLSMYGPPYVRMRAELEQTVDREGIAFVPYEHYAGDYCGMTWQSHRWITERMNELHGDSMRLVRLEPDALYGHQDVCAYERTD